DGKIIDDFSSINKELLLSDPKHIVVERNGSTQDISVQKYKDDQTIEKLEKSKRAMVEPRFPFVIEEVTNKALLKAGMRKEGEKLVSVNGKKITYYDEFKTEMLKNINKKIRFETIRDGKTFVTYEMMVPETGRLGFITQSPVKFLEFSRIEYNFFEAIPAGVKMTFDKLSSYVKGLKLLFDPEIKGYKYIGGFGAMASGTPKDFSMEGFLVFTAVISIILAFMNFLPIPMLDGGYVVFILYEMITRKQPSERFMEITNYFGMIFLFGLMIYANGNDFYRSFIK
ncbi:MAG TPA: M50 family metallopeptidase, partial [Cytophagaceae bacterium]|nr:M50 family metallopeptidase [Cytophagaceae bacterium]